MFDFNGISNITVKTFRNFVIKWFSLCYLAHFSEISQIWKYIYIPISLSG